MIEETSLEPEEQETVEFHGENIIAVRLADGRICVVLRWVCESMKLAPNGQVRKIARTASLAEELVRVRIQTRGGKQSMPAITLRGFSPWILTVNPGEIKHDDPKEEERIRALIVAYQQEAKDVLYEHFVSKRSLVASEPEVVEARAARAIAERATPLEPARPQEPALTATEEELTTYYENLALWALWQANRYGQKWRIQVEARFEEQEARLEGSEAISRLLPEIIDRLGPEKITPTHQGQIRGYVKQLHTLTGKPYPTIYEDIRLAFGPARYQDLLESDWMQIEYWFRGQIQRAMH